MTQLHSQLNTRAKVVATLERIQQGESLSSLLDPLLNQVSEKDKGFAHELLLGTLRQWWALARAPKARRLQSGPWQTGTGGRLLRRVAAF